MLDKTGKEYNYEESEEEQEDLEASFAYIDQLPPSKIRGLQFPTDTRGYYVCWPDRSYYKYRLFNPGLSGKYLSPRGHKPGLFWGRQWGGVLAIVEGEINCITIATAMPKWAVCSPGSASMFNMHNLSKYLPQFQQYDKVIVITDKDASGTKAFIEAKAFLSGKVPFTSFIQMEQDANEILNEKGSSALQEELQRLCG